jgi:hypothetical protein
LMYGRHRYGYSGRRGLDFKMLGFLLALVLGLYLMNNAFNWVAIPNEIRVIDRYIDGIAGILLLLLGLSLFLRRPYGSYEY